MSFDFFNPSHLAFGSKLTKAFNQLDRLYLDAQDAFNDLKRVYDTYNQYVGKNYLCPTPNRPDAPCRTNELFDLINDVNTIKELKVKGDGKLFCAVNIFKRSTNRITIASGETELKAGYVFYTPSISNRQPERTLQFVEDQADGDGNFLFEFRVDDDNNINIVGDSSSYFLPGTIDSFNGMKYDSDVLVDAHTGGSTYTATDNECIVCVGYARYGENRQYTDGSTLSRWSQLTIRVNGNLIFNITGIQQRNFGVVYLKPGDVLSGDIKQAFRVKYTGNKVPVPSPIDVNFEYLDDVGTYEVTSGSVEGFLNDRESLSIDADVGSNIGFIFKAEDWENVKSIKFDSISNYNNNYSSLMFLSDTSAGSGGYQISNIIGQDIDIDGIKSYFNWPENDFKFRLTLMKASNLGTPIVLSGFSFKFKD